MLLFSKFRPQATAFADDLGIADNLVCLGPGRFKLDRFPIVPGRVSVLQVRVVHLCAVSNLLWTVFKLIVSYTQICNEATHFTGFR